MQCIFEDTIIYPHGETLYTICINEADILNTKDPCFGLCFTCAYNKMKAENEQLKKELEKDCDCGNPIDHNYCNRCRRQWSS